MKPLLQCYTESELNHLLIEGMQAAARENPGERQTHLLVNGLRLTLTFNGETNEFSLYIGRALAYPDKPTTEALRLAFGAEDFAHLPAREYFLDGVLYRAPGIRWDDGPPSPNCQAELRAMYEASKYGGVLKLAGVQDSPRWVAI